MAVDGRLGTDLRLLRNLTRQNSRNPGSDLSTATRRPASPGENPQSPPKDLQMVAAVENLEQALLLRFLTRVGELTALGHPKYGSRLFELIGQLNNESSRNRAKVYVLQALSAEPRVKQIRSVKVTPDKSERTQINIDVSLLVIDHDNPLNLVFSFSLQGTPAR
jgi:phage baseplate assembly protein W